MQQAITVATSQAQAEATKAAQRTGIQPFRQRDITGFSAQGSDTAAKRIELLHKVVPGLRRLAVLAAVVPQSALEIDAIQTAGGSSPAA